MQKIVINGRFFTQKVTGVQRYAHEVVGAIDAILQKKEHPISEMAEFEIAMPCTGLVELPRFSALNIKKIGSRSGHAWEQIDLPFYSGRHPLLNFCNAAPILKKRQLVTIHDAAVFATPGSYSWKFGAWYRFMFRRLMRSAAIVITDSKFSSRQLSEYCGVKREAGVLWLGIDHVNNLRPDDSIIKKYNLQKPFILAVSSFNPNKNFQLVIDAVASLAQRNYTFVIAGEFRSSIFNFKEQKLPQNVVTVGYVTDAQLKALYEAASVFVYPSLYEGFGLPPLEALSCGCPVIVSGEASLPEVCGDAVLYCDAHNPIDLARHIDCVLSDANLRNSLKNKGFIWIKQFQWCKTATSILDRCLELIA